VPPKEPADKTAVQRLLGLSEEIFEPLWQDATQLIGAAPLRRFFQPDEYVRAYNEVSFCAEDGAVKRLDRLVEFADSVWCSTTRQEKSQTKATCPRCRPVPQADARIPRSDGKGVPEQAGVLRADFQGGQLCQVGD